MSAKSSLDIDHGDWFTPPQAAKEGRIPGARNEKAVRELIAKREIESVEINGRYYVSAAAIRAYVRRNTRRAA